MIIEPAATSKAKAMDCKNVKFSQHGLERMFERSITEADVLKALQMGQIVEDYPDDIPYPSQLLLGSSGNSPLHVVAAQDPVSRTCIVITMYVPNIEQWGNDFRTRRAK